MPTAIIAVYIKDEEYRYFLDHKERISVHAREVIKLDLKKGMGGKK